MFSKFDEEAQKVMLEAKREMQALKHPYVGSEHLMLAILKGNNDVSKKLKTFGIDYKKFKNEIINIIGEGSTESDWFLYTPLLKRTLESAVNDAKEVDGVVTISNLFYSILEEGEGVAIRIMLGMNVDMDKIYSYFSRKMVKKSNSKKKLLLEELGTNLNKLASDGKVDPVIGRENEINRILEILCRRTKNNPILIGEAGVGKTAIVEELASRIVSGDVPDILKNKVDIPLLSLDSSYINKMEKILKETIIGQDKQIDELLNISKINSLNYNKNKCISLLFAGSTGTGKTMLAKTYGKLIAGDMNVIKLDMSEYSEPHSISKIIGAPPGYVGYSDSRNVLEEIKDKPTAVLILDEIERCNKSVLNLFLQILDEGYTKDSLGRKIYFDNVTIIMTSNIGFNKNCMGFNNSSNITSKLKDILGVEFINRISKTITFNKITESDARKIICNGIEKLRCEYKVKLDVSDDLIDDMVNESNYSLFGARRIKEIVRNRIENVILDELMNDNKNISIDMSKDKACINN